MIQRLHLLRSIQSIKCQQAPTGKLMQVHPAGKSSSHPAPAASIWQEHPTIKHPPSTHPASKLRQTHALCAEWWLESYNEVQFQAYTAKRSSVNYRRYCTPLYSRKLGSKHCH
jgi:hypothetical protein